MNSVRGREDLDDRGSNLWKGQVLSHVVLAVLFYGLLTPIALFFRLIGRDPLKRRWEPEQKSYWVDLPEAFDKKDYFRQF